MRILGIVYLARFCYCHGRIVQQYTSRLLAGKFYWLKRVKEMKFCIMPEMPYCPACEYGYIVAISETDCEWHCMYDGKNICEKEGENEKVLHLDC